MNDNSIVFSIQSKYNELSKSHKKIADFVLGNYDKAVFMTADKLGKASKTSEATVVRFATTLGYKSYGEFNEALSDWVSEGIEKKKNINYQAKISSVPDTLKVIFEKDINNLKATMEEFDLEAFNQAVENIVSSKNVYLIGLRTSEPLAGVLSIYLNLIRDGIHLISSNTTSEIYEKMLHIGSDDVLISFGFPDYSVRTLKAMEFANVRKAKIISITDNPYSPMTMYTSCVLTAKCDMTDEVESMTCAMSLINALVVALINKTGNAFKNNLDHLDRTLEDLNG